MQEPKIAEAALFMSPEPLALEQLAKLMGTESMAKARHAMDAAIEDFNKRNEVLEIVKTQDERYQMRVKNQFLGQVQHLAITTDLSRAVLRTLAIIAYKQPIRQSIIVKMRGNKSYEHIAQLEEEGFIRKVKESNTFSLETTKKFEEYFGPPVKDLELAPKSAQEILGESQTTLAQEAAAGLAEAAHEAAQKEKPQENA